MKIIGGFIFHVLLVLNVCAEARELSDPLGQVFSKVDVPEFSEVRKEKAKNFCSALIANEEAGSLIAAVHEDPNDDSPRLAFADWLEERGNPRAEFIRVQVELANLEALGNFYELSRENRARARFLRKTANELFSSHGHEWIPDWILNPPPGIKILSFSFRRGFVSHLKVALPTLATTKGLATIRRLSPTVDGLTLVGNLPYNDQTGRFLWYSITNEMMRLNVFKGLTSLGLDGLISQNLLVSGQLSQLKSLELSSRYTDTVVTIPELTDFLPNLTRIDLRGMTTVEGASTSGAFSKLKYFSDESAYSINGQRLGDIINNSQNLLGLGINVNPSDFLERCSFPSESQLKVLSLSFYHDDEEAEGEMSIQKNFLVPQHFPSSLSYLNLAANISLPRALDLLQGLPELTAADLDLVFYFSDNLELRKYDLTNLDALFVRNAMVGHRSEIDSGIVSSLRSILRADSLFRYQVNYDYFEKEDED